jgi:hypothetical protein
MPSYYTDFLTIKLLRQNEYISNRRQTEFLLPDGNRYSLRCEVIGDKVKVKNVAVQKSVERVKNTGGRLPRQKTEIFKNLDPQKKRDLVGESLTSVNNNQGPHIPVPYEKHDRLYRPQRK